MVGIRTENGNSAIYPIGTCFFARRADALFLITAKHNISGFNTFNLKHTPSQFDTVGFRYFDPKNKKISFASLNVIPMKKELVNDYFYESPDLVVLKMNDPMVEPYINSMEKYMVTKKEENEKLDSVISFGYAFADPNIFKEDVMTTYYKGVLADLVHQDPYDRPNDNIYYRTQPKSIQGMSGSPVFLKFKSEKGIRFLFGGVLFGGNQNNNSAYIVIPELVNSQVKDFIFQPK